MFTLGKRATGAAILAIGLGMGLAATGGPAHAGEGVVDYGARVPSMNELREAFRGKGRGGDGTGGAKRMIVVDPPRNQSPPSDLAPAAAPQNPPSRPPAGGQAAAPTQRPQQAATQPAGPQGVSIRIQFALNSTEIQPEFRPHIARIAEMMREMHDRRFLVVGHADALGPRHTNQTLSERRARSVMSALVFDYGIDPKQVSSRGAGERSPRYRDPYDPRNRRVEFLLQ